MAYVSSLPDMLDIVGAHQMYVCILNTCVCVFSSSMQNLSYLTRDLNLCPSEAQGHPTLDLQGSPLSICVP